MKRFGSIFVCAVVPALSACNGGPGGVCDPTTDDCGNVDMQIDGEAEGEAFYSEDVQLCAAGDGTIYAAWVDDRRELFDVWFNKSTDGGNTWLPQPVQVKQGPGDASGVDMSCNGERIYVAWEDTRDSLVGYQNIYVNFSNNGGENWLKNDRLIDTFDPDGRHISLGPQIGFRGPNVHVAWSDQIEGAPDIYVASSFDSGNAWESPIRLSGEPLAEGGLDPDAAGESWSGNPKMEIDADGRVHLIWEDKVFGAADPDNPLNQQDILYARSTDNTAQNWGARTWRRPTRKATDPQSFALTPQLGVDGESVYIVWSDDRNGDAPDVYLVYSGTGGNTFDDAIRLDDDETAGAFSSLYPALVVAGDTAHVAWQDDVNGGYDILYRRVVAGVPDEDADGLDAGDAPGRSNSTRPVLALGDGVVVAAWQERRVDAEGGFNELMYNFSDGEESPNWSGNNDWRLDTVRGGSSYTRDHTAVTFGGEVFAAWTDFRNGEDDPDIRFSHTPTGEAVLTVEEIERLSNAATTAQ